MTKKNIPIRINGRTHSMTVLREETMVVFHGDFDFPVFFPADRMFLVNRNFIPAKSLKSGDVINVHGEMGMVKSVKKIIS